MPEIIEIPDPNVYVAYGVYFLKVKHKFVQRLKRHHQPGAHGYRMWGTSFVLMDYLQHYPPKSRSIIMDVGCGWAPVGVFCASQFKAKVIGADMDSHVVPYMDLLAALNDVKVENLTTRFDRITTKQLSGLDLVVGSDICFWDEMVNALYNLIQRAFRGGVPRIAIADPGRAPFFKLAERCGAKWNAELTPWYSLEPRRQNGDVLEIRNPNI